MYILYLQAEPVARMTYSQFTSVVYAWLAVVSQDNPPFLHAHQEALKIWESTEGMVRVSLEIAIGLVMQLAVGYQLLHAGETLSAAQG